MAIDDIDAAFFWSIDSFAQKMYGHVLAMWEANAVGEEQKFERGPGPTCGMLFKVAMVFRRVFENL